MRFILAAALILAANISYGSECKIIDYGDHYEAVCEGTGTGTAVAAVSPQASPPAAVAGPTAAPQQALAGDPSPADVMVAQEQASDSEEVAIVRSEIGRRHAEYWLAATPRY